MAVWVRLKGGWGFSVVDGAKRDRDVRRIFFGCVLLICFLVKIPEVFAEGTANSGRGKQETTQEALEDARELFLDAMDALSRAGKLAYDKNTPEIRDKARDVLEESKKLLEELMDRVQREMDRQGEGGQENVREPKEADRSSI